MEEIRHFDDDADLKDEVFWGIMEGKGWSFMWDAEYRRVPCTVGRCRLTPG